MRGARILAGLVLGATLAIALAACSQKGPDGEAVPQSGVAVEDAPPDAASAKAAPADGKSVVTTVATAADAPKPQDKTKDKPEKAPLQPLEPKSFAGKWQITDGKSGKICAITLDGKVSDKGLKASSSGCSTAELGRISGWQLEGDAITLVKSGGAAIAHLKASNANRLDGSLEQGASLTAWR